MSDTIPPNLWRDFGKELDALKAENALLRQQLNELRTEAPKHQPNIPDAELMEALAEFDSDLVLNGNQESAKKELVALLDDLEVMIESLNTGTGMGLHVPEKLNEIRNSLNT
jgi:hypothetical protein